MLSFLRIRNFAIIDELEVSFGNGLNIITGETGAGKSIILNSIELLTGKRASADIIRHGEQQCIIEAVFELSDSDRQILQAIAPEISEIFSGQELLVKRVIDSSGRAKVLLNNELGTVAQLQQTIGALVDITSQHQQHYLCSSDRQRELLDSFGETETLCQKVQASYQVYAQAKAKLEAFRDESATQLRRIETLRFEKEELDKAALQADERSVIEARLKVLESSEQIVALLNESLGLIDTEEPSLDSMLRRVSSILQSAENKDPALGEAKSCVENAHIQLSEAKLLIEAYAANINVDERELEQMRARVAEIAHLERKYKKSESELICYLQEISAELGEFDAGLFSEEALEQKLKESEQQLVVHEGKLTAAREKAAKQLTKAIEKGLAEVNMRRAKFSVALEPIGHSAHGQERIVFLLAANPGEELRALAKVASGGELSRVLLILKTVLGEKAGASTQIFDEIDTGVSGAVAQAVGEKLKEAATRTQVIIVTHAPQIAALASTHLQLRKSVAGERTTVAATNLNREQRIEEIAQMLSGKKITEQFLASARELLGTVELKN